MRPKIEKNVSTHLDYLDHLDCQARPRPLRMRGVDSALDHANSNRHGCATQKWEAAGSFFLQLFAHGREQMKVLAGLEVTTKSVERTAEALGDDIAGREQQQIQRAVQLDLPVIIGKPIPILYVQMDGTGVPVLKKETEGRPGKTGGQPAHTREVKWGCVFTQTTWDREGYPIRDPASTTYTGAIETAGEFGKRIYLEAWQRGWGRAKKRSLWAMARNGPGISPKNTFREPFRLWISTMLASICGRWHVGCTPMMKLGRKPA